MTAKVLAATILSGLMLGCTEGGYIDSSGSTYGSTSAMRFVEPKQAWRDWRGNCIAEQECWEQIDQKSIRRRLSLQEAESNLYKREADGSFSYLGSGAKISSGRYILEKYIVAYANKPCRQDDPDAGVQRVGVGVRVTADITTRARTIDLVDLFSVAVAASQKQISGKIKISSWGINSNNSTLNSLIKTTSVSLDDAGVQAAISALQIGEAMLDDPQTQLDPWTFAVVEEVPRACNG